MSDRTSTTPGDVATTESAVIVESFLTALAHGDVDAALPLLTDDIAWINASLPTLRGARLVGRVLRSLNGGRLRFDVIMHEIAVTDGGIVLTERTDLLAVGPLSVEFWVCGTFELRGGKVAVWRDYFSVLNFTGAIVVGLARLTLGRRGPRFTGYLGA